jgi:hypothetical protein
LRDIQKLIARQIPVVEDHPHVSYGGVSVDAAPVVASAIPSNGHGRSGRNSGGSNNQQQGGQRRNGQQQAGRRHPGNGNQGGQQRNSGHGNQGGGQRNDRPGGRPPRREQPAQQLEPMPGERISNGTEPQRERQQNNGQQGVQRGDQNGQQGVQRGDQNGQQGVQPDGKRNPAQKPPRKNAGELKMPEQGKEYKDPMEGLGLKINRSEGDEKW